jgi:hypothetical protein
MVSGSFDDEMCRDDEHDGIRVGQAEIAGRAQGREGAVATHETEVITLRRCPQAEVAHQTIVGPGGEETRARHRDDVRDVRGRQTPGCRERTPCRREEQLGRPVDVDLVAHARRRVAQHPRLAVDEDVLVAELPAQLVEHGVARLDRRRIERGPDQTVRQAPHPGLGAKQIPHVGLSDDRFRHSCFEGSYAHGHTSL